MNSCKSFAGKYPAAIAALTMAFLFALLKFSKLFPETPLDLGITEVFLAVMVFGWTFLFMGKEKVSFRKEGFGYTFRLFRGYLIALSVFCGLGLAGSLIGREIPDNLPVNVLNSLLAGAAVGIVEEFTFRGLVFGGLLQKLGNSKKGIITAAVISGLLFGAFHIINSAIAGEITGLDTVATAAMKTVQTGIFGIILAFVYYKTRNLYAVAALHSLNDLILFFSTVARQEAGKADSYVSGDITLMIVSYSIFTLIMVPMLVKCIRDIHEKEAIPFDEDFLPRAVKFEKSTKKLSAQ